MESNGITIVVKELRITEAAFKGSRIEDSCLVLSLEEPAHVEEVPGVKPKGRGGRRKTNAAAPAVKTGRKTRRSCSRCASFDSKTHKCGDKDSLRHGNRVTGQMCCNQFIGAAVDLPALKEECGTCLWRGRAPDHKCGNQDSGFFGKVVPEHNACTKYEQNS